MNDRDGFVTEISRVLAELEGLPAAPVVLLAIGTPGPGSVNADDVAAAAGGRNGRMLVRAYEFEFSFPPFGGDPWDDAYLAQNLECERTMRPALDAVLERCHERGLLWRKEQKRRRRKCAVQ